jgi:hypothetical protein
MEGESMKIAVLAAIAEIVDDKKAAGVYPAAASRLEIARILWEESEKVLVSLEKEGRIVSHENFNKTKFYQFSEKPKSNPK